MFLGMIICVKWLKNKYQSGVIGDLVEADFYCGSWLPDWRPNTDYRMGVSARKNLGEGFFSNLVMNLIWQIFYWMKPFIYILPLCLNLAL